MHDGRRKIHRDPDSGGGATEVQPGYVLSRANIGLFSEIKQR
jgi:hypothetical protein